MIKNLIYHSKRVCEMFFLFLTYVSLVPTLIFLHLYIAFHPQEKELNLCAKHLLLMCLGVAQGIGETSEKFMEKMKQVD